MSVATTDDAPPTVKGERQYYPYGTERSASGGIPTHYRFTGQRRVAAIGLYDYGARWYDPYLGRFVSADTVVPNPAAPMDLNRYAYVRGNPLTLVDPSGHDPWWAEEWARKPLLPLPPQPQGTTWDTPLHFWIEPGGFYGEGSVSWNVNGRTAGPVSVYVPSSNSQGVNWRGCVYEEGWKYGGGYIGLSDITKPGFWNVVANVSASYAAARSDPGWTADPATIGPQKIDVNPRNIGQSQDIYVPGRYEMGGLGSGTQLEAAVSLLDAISPGENISLRYVSITVQQKGYIRRALVVAEYPGKAYVSYSDEGAWYKETLLVRPPDVDIIGQDWSKTTLGRR